ncbi:MAG: response regulator [Candidatus Wallbacteria bacterium]|nr:response regulator [Candidatus Wallbacteria bacterium]
MTEPKPKVLVVDDEPALLVALQDLFTLEGYEVTACLEPRQAMTALGQVEYDCVVTDLLMPGISGLEIVRTTHQRWPETGIVVITGAPELTTAIEAMQCGASDYVIKPVFERGVEFVVRRVIEQTAMRRAIRRKNEELSLLLEASRRFGLAEDLQEVAEANEGFERRLQALGEPEDCRTTLSNMAAQTRERVMTRRLREQARLGALLESHPDGIVVLDESGELLVVSSRARELLGNELAGKSSPAMARLREISRGGGAGEFRSPADPARLLQVRTAHVMDGDRPAGMIATLADVTENRDRELQAFTSARLSAIGEIVAGVCHELNNPLAIIIGLSEELISDAPHPWSDRSRRILESASRCAEFVRKLVPIVRRAREAPSALDLPHLLRAVLGVLNGQLVQHGIETDLDLQPVQRVHGLASELNEAMLALLLNAIDAMPRGGKLSVATRPDGDGHVTLEIRDTGEGIAESARGRIFDPFFTTKAGTRATGLGLTVVHSVCTRMGAAISVDSTPGNGTRFLLRFPAVHS